MEGLNDPLDRIPLTFPLRIIGPEQQLKIHEGIVSRKGELRWLPPSQLQTPIQRVEAALPDAAVEQKVTPLA